MNEIRHVMLPRLDDPPKPVKHQPWYKERLKTKYLSNKKTTPLQKEKILDAKQWTFVKDGLDDFRDGKAPPHDDILIKPAKGPGPNLKNEKRVYKQSVLPPVKRYTVEQRCFSRALPLVEAKKERIDQLIYGLTQHPLALYPHMEDGLPADLFEEVVDLLDPEMNHMNVTETPDINAAEKSHSAFTSQSFRTRDSSSAHTNQKLTRGGDRRQTPSDFDRSTATSATTIAEADRRPVRNTYKWLLRKEEARANAKGPDSDELKAQAIDNHIKNVTEDFCDWIKGLGGNEHNLDPVTLTSLFASGYETKPALSVPIHVVELTNIPAELRDTATAVTSNENMEQNIEDFNEYNVYKTERQRYGAWYLPKSLWRMMPADEKLVDPKLAVDKDKEEAQKKVEEMNIRLAPLHATKSFKEFVKSRNLPRVPKMLGEIDQWHDEDITRASITEAEKEALEKLKD